MSPRKWCKLADSLSSVELLPNSQPGSGVVGGQSEFVELLYSSQPGSGVVGGQSEFVELLFSSQPGSGVVGGQSEFVELLFSSQPEGSNTGGPESSDGGHSGSVLLPFSSQLDCNCSDGDGSGSKNSDGGHSGSVLLPFSSQSGDDSLDGVCSGVDPSGPDDVHPESVELLFSSHPNSDGSGIIGSGPGGRHSGEFSFSSQTNGTT